jgi:hypothetical protein
MKIKVIEHSSDKGSNKFQAVVSVGKNSYGAFGDTRKKALLALSRTLESECNKYYDLGRDLNNAAVETYQHYLDESETHRSKSRV